MAQYISLYSGSSGNCSLVVEDGKFIIIDMGKSARLTTKAINDVGLDMKNLQGILVSHEHSDHTAGLNVFLKKLAVPLYTNSCTLDYLADNSLIPGHIDAQDIDFTGSNIGPFFVEGFDTPHDSVGCMGFKIHTQKGTSMAIATDLGCVTNHIYNKLQGNELVVLESNYDEQMLKEGPYPQYLKVRISSNRGHLSNAQSSVTTLKLIDNGVKKIQLCHLSNTNNTPSLALQQIVDMAERNGIVIGQDVSIRPNRRHEITLPAEF
ncbi:MAG: MBL fold metallo-hydrolase [Oscillospiraceae bacterium]